MKRLTIPALLLALMSGAFAQDEDPYSVLRSRMRQVVEKMNEAFVFFPTGSGSLVSEDGYVFTNHHVAGGQAAVPVWTANGKRYRAARVATDPDGDVALFKIDAPEAKFTYVELGDSDALKVGQYVIAIGNPHGLGTRPVGGRHEPTVSLGIVSAMHRMQGGYSDAIQTDASVNPGNSGGPLLTLDGKQVGINGRVATRFGNRINSGVGYAIPSNQLKRFLPVMKEGGHEDQRAYHGRVDGLTLASEHTDGRGALVARVRPASPADRAGLAAKDMIVGVEEYSIHSRARFQGVIGTYPAGATVKVRYRRDSGQHETSIKLARVAPPPRPPRFAGYLGVRVEETDEGLRVTNVISGSPAEEANVQVGDILTKVADKPVGTLHEFQQLLWEHRAGERVKITVLRDGVETDLDAMLGRRPN